MWSRRCVILILSTILSLGLSLIEEIRLPDEFSECIERHTAKSNTSATTSESIDNFCINRHRMNLARPYLTQANVSKDMTNWIDELLRMSSVETYEHEQALIRNKRQAVGVPALRGGVQTAFQNVQQQPMTLQNIPAGQFSQQQSVPRGFQSVSQGAFEITPQQAPQPVALQQQQVNPSAQTFQQQNLPSQSIQQQNVPAQDFQQQNTPAQQNVNTQSSVAHIVYQQNVPTGPVPTQPPQVSIQQPQQQPQQQPPPPPPTPPPPQQQQPQQQQQQTSPTQTFPSQPQAAQAPPVTRPTLRLRKEYRRLTDQERNDFHRAVQMLKADTTISPNRYDALALVHFRLVNNIHHGSGFLPWHRVFITIFENALRQKVPTVALPYWDSTLDEAMMDPTQSILFSPMFAGNGNGLVTTGPFAYWQTPSGPLIRNIGQGGGSLFSRQEIMAVLSRSRLSEIEEPDADNMFNLENYHGDVHTWLGGEMEPMETSAFDPLFYMHHCFVDYVWEIFRTRQRAMGIDPTRDYPSNFGSQTHSPFFRMGFGDLQNSFGLSDMFTTQIYTYEQNPSCSVSSPNCGSRYLSCDLSQGIAQCLPAATEVSNAAPVQQNQAGFGGAAAPNQFAPGMGMGAGGFGQPVPMFGRRKRQVDKKNIARAKKVLEENARNKAVSKGTHTCTGTWLSFSSQNTFEVDGVSDTRNWVFIPVKIISKRSPEHRKFQAFPIFDGRASRDYDIYDPDAYPEISPYFSEQVMPSSNICNSRVTDRTVGRVHIRSNGLNYHGNYEEYTVVDLRQAFSESSTYIALKDPEDDMSEVILTAYDSCGRRCKPYCRSSDPKRPGYHSCSGALRVTKDTPWMYGKNYGDAVRMSWNIQSLTDIPELKADYNFIQFYCDHTD